jgi:hypothetical protein
VEFGQLDLAAAVGCADHHHIFLDISSPMSVSPTRLDPYRSFPFKTQVEEELRRGFHIDDNHPTC